MLDNNATREPFSRKINARNVGFSIRQALRDYFANDAADFLSLSFDGEKFNQKQEINFKELLLEICENNENEAGFSDFKNYLNGENDKFKLAMSFDKAVFENYPSFDELRCHKLSFSNTVFKKGVRLRHIDVDEVLFEPRELGADATFFHREKANIDDGILRGKEIGKIGKFKYRHQFEGGGTTFLIGMRFTEKAEFTDCVLDKVQFSFIDDDSMSKCFFANSIIENTRFHNCSFPYRENISMPFQFLDGKSLISRLVTPILFSLALSSGVYEFSKLILFTQNTQPYIYLMIPFLVFVFIFTYAAFFNAFLFMLFMKLIGKILARTMFLKINHHIHVGDDELAEPNSEFKKSNRETVREIYRQLRINYDKSGDYQKAGEFYYSQKYLEMVSGRNNLFKFVVSQALLIDIHHFINGFGERWIRAFIWFMLTILGFAFFLYTPNKDFISTKSTPEYFLNAFQETNEICKNDTYKLDFNESSVTDKLDKKAHFILIAKTSFEADKNKTIYAFDNRFDYHYAMQYIPMLKDDYGIKIAYSLSKMIAPFVSEEKKWFQDRSERGYYLGFLESILLWIFFVAFLLAVKNRIRR